MPHTLKDPLDKRTYEVGSCNRGEYRNDRQEERTRKSDLLEDLSDIFGGGAYSKLFRNVREKQSLCYYCSASAVFKKGYMIVDSGVDEKNAEQLIDAVNNELNEIKKGNFDDSDIANSKKAIREILMSYYDSASTLDLWYCRNFEKEHIVSPMEFADKIISITKEEIISAANCYKLHTIYKLLPEGSEG